MRCSRWWRAIPQSVISLREFITPRSQPPTARTTGNEHCVILSNSHDIFENLSAEEALLRGVVLDKGQTMLFLYVNAPCVVVGRNQNVVEEVALRRSFRDGVGVARRSSGGGAVYHDMGNLCFSFFTHRADYAPEKTIQLVRWGLCAHCGIDPSRLTSSKRYDLYLDGKKITGSAMRVQRDIAFHHCTLLVDSDRARLGQFLHSEADLVACTSPAVGSVRSTVTTLEHEKALPAVTSANTHGPTHARVEVLRRGMSAFFLANVDTIMRHSAPWDLQLDALRGASAEDSPAVVLDVHGGAIFDMVYGSGRTASPADATTLEEEVSRMRTRDWVLAMPKYTTHTQITREEAAHWLSRHPRWLELVEACGLTPAEVADELATALLGSGGAMHLRATIDHRRLTTLVAALGPALAPSAADSTPTVDASWRQTTAALPWLDVFFAATIVGEQADAPFTFPCDSSLVSGFRIEAHDEFIAKLDLPAAAINLCCEVFLTQLLACWQHKNVLDF